ncbi:Copper amine oxidase N-terminal domain-containing protein [Paenibacillus uliginis N3/975]|uniref:Copper amine oxidase N-terminal domain-containing protein n=1 Tax=Paenibacillus uliginis N3/975 TaxID=1313296 RepID=A0A1X7HUF6_9BACL|nr:copper amine oxidase N-terminal domain-containing protein [Paenibacillus uliginis]SMF92594.1 Copper amine oxidase N-terminal domain-containing protein [Paenibacillus uliginis N3/975]
MKSVKSYKITGAAALALTLVLTPLSGVLSGSAQAASAAVAQKESQKTSWNVELTNAPFKKNGVVFVPIKELSEYLDLHITVTPNKKYVYINSPFESVRIASGQSKAVNAKGTSIALGTTPIVKHGVTYVPTSLLAKSFGIPVKWNGKSKVSLQGSKQYASGAVGGMVFWLSREDGTLLTGQAGSVPKKAGKASIEHIDLLNIKPRKINPSSYVVDINNSYGEPHIHESHIRVLIYNGMIVNAGSTYYANFSGRNTKPNIDDYKGNVAIMNGSTLQLVHPTGKVVKTYNLEAITGVKDDFVVEAIEPEFLLVRPYKKATLFIVHPTAKQSILIYQNLQLDDEAKKLIEEYPPNEAGYVGDGLTYTGFKNQKLTFNWSHPLLDKNKTFTYKLPF